MMQQSSCIIHGELPGWQMGGRVQLLKRPDPGLTSRSATFTTLMHSHVGPNDDKVQAVNRNCSHSGYIEQQVKLKRR